MSKTMLPWLRKAFATAMLFISLPVFSIRAEDLPETEIVPAGSDNFYEARARIWVPERSTRVRGILVFLGGTDSDSRGITEDANWRSFVEKNDMALLGCYFRGNGEPYEQASKGSGAALLEMIAQLAKKTRKEELGEVPLLFVGHSAGAMFSYNFACWAPHRTAAFASLKSGPISEENASPSAALVPGLFIVGERDMTGRVRTVAKTFDRWQGPNCRWALAVEPNAGHEGTSASTELMKIYLEEALRMSPGQHADEIRLGDLQTASLFPRSSNPENMERSVGSMVWFPGSKSARFWEKFTKGSSSAELARSGGLDEPGVVFGTQLNFGEIARAKALSAKQILEDFTVTVPFDGDWMFASGDPGLSVESRKHSETGYTLRVCIKNPREKNGWYRSSVIGKAKGNVSAGQMEFPVIAHFISPVTAQPASLYVGVLPRGTSVEKTILLSSSETRPLRIRSIQSSRKAFAKATVKSLDGTTTSITLRFDGKAGLGDQSGFFDITFDGMETEKIRIPFIAWVSKDQGTAGKPRASPL